MANEIPKAKPKVETPKVETPKVEKPVETTTAKSRETQERKAKKAKRISDTQSAREAAKIMKSVGDRIKKEKIESAQKKGKEEVVTRLKNTSGWELLSKNKRLTKSVLQDIKEHVKSSRKELGSSPRAIKAIENAAYKAVKSPSISGSNVRYRYMRELRSEADKVNLGAQVRRYGEKVKASASKEMRDRMVSQFESKEMTRKNMFRSLKQYAENKIQSIDEARKFIATLKSAEIKTPKDLKSRLDDVDIRAKKVADVQAKAYAEMVVEGKRSYVEKLFPTKQRQRFLPKEANDEIKILLEGARHNKDIQKKNEYLDTAISVVKKYSEKFEAIKQINRAVGLAKKRAIKAGVPNKTVKRLIEIHGLLRNEKLYKQIISGEKSVGDISAFIKRLRTLKQGDTFLPKGAVDSLTALDIDGERWTNIPKKDLLSLSERELHDKYGTGANILGLEGSAKSKIIKEMTGIANMKEKHPFLKQVLDYTQKEEHQRNKNLGRLENESKSLHKDWKKSTPKKERFDSMRRIFENLEGANNKLVKNESDVYDYMRYYFDSAQSWMKTNVPNFKARSNYAPHIQATFEQYVNEFGWKEGAKKFMNDKAMMRSLKGQENALLFLHKNVSDSLKAGFLKAREGKLYYSTDPFEVFSTYVQQFEEMKYINKVLPKLTAVQHLFAKTDAIYSWIGEHKAFVKGRKKDEWDKAVDFLASTNYATKLAVSPLSAAKNIIGGTTNNIIENGLINYARGTERMITNGMTILRIAKDNGLLAGDYTEIGKNISLKNKTSKILMDTALLNQKIAEMQIRLTQVAGLLTKDEIRSGVIPSSRAVDILDNLERTQGVYTRSRTAHGFQSKAGRLFATFQRYKFMNAALMTNAFKKAVKYSKEGDKTAMTKELMKVGRAVTLYYFGTMMAAKAAQAGHDKLSKLFESAEEPVRVLKDPDAWLSMITEGANTQLISQIVNTARIASYNAGLSKRPYGMENMKTLKDAYFAPKIAMEDLGLIQPSSPKSLAGWIDGKDVETQKKVLSQIRKEDKILWKNTLQYMKWRRLGVTSDEQEISYMNKDDTVKYGTRYIKSLSIEDRKEALMRMLRAGILSAPELRLINLNLSGK